MGKVKPKKHTQQATTILKCILDKEANHMLHRIYFTKSREKVVSKILPATFQWKDQQGNDAFGLKAMSSSNLSKIRGSRFSEYDVRRPGDNFSRYGTCNKYKELRRDAIGGSHDALKWSRKLDKHLAIARAHKDITMQIDTTPKTTSMSA